MYFSNMSKDMLDFLKYSLLNYLISYGMTFVDRGCFPWNCCSFQDLLILGQCFRMETTPPTPINLYIFLLHIHLIQR